VLIRGNDNNDDIDGVWGRMDGGWIVIKNSSMTAFRKGLPTLSVIIDYFQPPGPAA
jgi:hypothetical protein